MTLRAVLTTAIIMLASLILWTCEKNNVSCSDEQEFCSLVDKQDFNGTGAIIDDYLGGLKKNNPNGNLQKLADWLECKSCVKKAEILCNSCIYTLPAKSELQVKFISGGQNMNKTLDISMGEPLQYSGYHDCNK